MSEQNKTYKNDPLGQFLIEITLRVAKENSAFTYFSFESNEGLAFYSTMDAEVGQPYRDIILKCTPEYKNAVLNLLDKLDKSYGLQILSLKKIADR